MKFNRKRTGERLLSMRKKLSINQSYLAAKLDISQSIISALETGSGGGIEPLFKLMEYYFEYLEFDNIFSVDFEPILKEKKQKLDADSKKNILVRLNNLKKDIGNIDLENSTKSSKKNQISSPDSKIKME